MSTWKAEVAFPLVGSAARFFLIGAPDQDAASEFALRAIGDPPNTAVNLVVRRIAFSDGRQLADGEVVEVTELENR